MTAEKVTTILDHLKSALGIGLDVTHFDDELITHANLVWIPLEQIGIEGKDDFDLAVNTTWTDYTDDVKLQNNLRGYLYMNVRLTFDSPTNSFLVESLKSQIAQLEWRLNVYANHKEYVKEDLPDE